MPIKSENRSLYPPDWQAIRERILERAGNHCEGSPAYPECRAANGRPHPVTRSRVVLTIGHKDHDPTHNDPENLAAWCQRCHLTHDADYHAVNARKTRVERRRASQPLLLEPE